MWYILESALSWNGSPFFLVLQKCQSQLTTWNDSMSYFLCQKACLSALELLMFQCQNDTTILHLPLNSWIYFPRLKDNGYNRANPQLTGIFMVKFHLLNALAKSKHWFDNMGITQCFRESHYCIRMGNKDTGLSKQYDLSQRKPNDVSYTVPMRILQPCRYSNAVIELSLSTFYHRVASPEWWKSMSSQLILYLYYNQIY